MTIKTIDITSIVKRTNEKVELLKAWENIKVRLNFYWNSHGKRILWNDSVKEQKNYSKANVRIEKFSFTEHFEYTGPQDFETWRLYINDRLIAGDVTNFRWVEDEDGIVRSCSIKLDCGWG